MGCAEESMPASLCLRFLMCTMTVLLAEGRYASRHTSSYIIRFGTGLPAFLSRSSRMPNSFGVSESSRSCRVALCVRGSSAMPWAQRMPSGRTALRSRAFTRAISSNGLKGLVM